MKVIEQVRCVAGTEPIAQGPYSSSLFQRYLNSLNLYNPYLYVMPDTTCAVIYTINFHLIN